MTPFDYIKSISHTKEKLELHKQYSKDRFIINRGLSLYPDTLFDANAMNMVALYITDQMHYDYLLNAVRPRKRWAKWPKDELKNDEDLKAIKEFYQYNDRKARQVLKLLSDDDLTYIKEKLDKGGSNRT